MEKGGLCSRGTFSPTKGNFLQQKVKVLEETHWLKLPALARHQSNLSCELFYDRRSW